MPSRNDFKNMAKTRLKEVKLLYEHGYFDGANYLSGYVIEAALKARICKILNQDYPDNGALKSAYFIHDIDRLIILAGLQKDLDNRKPNGAFNANWSLVTQWDQTYRYNVNVVNKQMVEDVLTALEDKTNGIFTWIKKKW